MKYIFIIKFLINIIDKIIKIRKNISWVHSVVVSRFLRKEKASGSNPDVSIFLKKSDFLLLKFMCHRGSFREDIYEKCILCKDANNGFEHVVNECKCLEEERKELINKLQYINNTWGTNLLREIEYHYYSVRYSNAESLAKRDNKGISLIKKFIRIMYLKLGKAKKDDAE